MAFDRIGDLELVQPCPGDDAAEARSRRGWSWSIRRSSPIGGVRGDDIPASGTLDAAMANPVSPLVNRRTTLKDALSMMLNAPDVQAAVVVDRSGAVPQ